MRTLADRHGPLLAQGAIGAAIALLATVVSAVEGGYFWPRWIWFALAVVLALQVAVRLARRESTRARRLFALQAWLTVVVSAGEIAVWALSGAGFFWPIFSIALYGIALGWHAVIVARRDPQREAELVRRVDVLTRTRRGAVDIQAAELKRIERDLHDGAQARMVSLAMNLGLAEQLTRRGDPDAVAALLAESRASTLTALDDLRTVMRGIQPPVLNDRGLVGAIEALALDVAVPTTVAAKLPGEPPTPVQSAVYLAVAECLANVVKHSRARTAWVTLRHETGVLFATVGDDGVGGATPGGGTGLAGIVRRLEVFDGTVRVHSPTGGPTEIVLEVPCELSSPKTSSSSGTD